MTMHKFFVVLAPGFYGDAGTRVLSSHYTLAAARRRAKTSGHGVLRYVVRAGAKKKRDPFSPAAESIYPIVEESE